MSVIIIIIIIIKCSTSIVNDLKSRLALTMFHIYLKRPRWIWYPGYFRVEENYRAGRLAGNINVTSGLHLGR